MIFQVKKKSGFVLHALPSLPKHARKKKEIEELQEEIKREKDGGCMSVFSHAYRCVCVTMKKSARRMASTTSDTGDTSSKQQQAQRKENYNKSKRPVSSVDHCHPYRRKKRREAVY